MKSTGIGFGKTKNETSIRTIKIDKKLMNTFKKFYLRSTPNKYDLIFYTNESKYNVLPNTATNKVLQGACKRLSIHLVTMHTLRHSCEYTSL